MLKRSEVLLSRLLFLYVAVYEIAVYSALASAAVAHSATCDAHLRDRPRNNLADLHTELLTLQFARSRARTHLLSPPHETMLHDAPIDRYSDPLAITEYLANPGAEASGSVCVDASPSDAFDAWLQHVWVGSWEELAPGVGRGLVGHAKCMPFGVAERIVSAGLPVADDPRKIASICYKAFESGLFPVESDSHIGLVRFVPVAGQHNQTLVYWDIKTTATPLGNVLLGGGALFRLVLRTMIRSALDSLQTHVITINRRKNKTKTYRSSYNYSYSTGYETLHAAPHGHMIM